MKQKIFSAALTILFALVIFRPCYAQSFRVASIGDNTISMLLVQKQNDTAKQFIAELKGSITAGVSGKIDSLDGAIQTLKAEDGTTTVIIKTELKDGTLVITTVDGKTYVIYDLNSNLVGNIKPGAEASGSVATVITENSPAVIPSLMDNASSKEATNAASTTMAGDRQFGVTFLVPKGIDLYSTANPGPLSTQISADAPFILVRPEFRDENINIKIANGVTDSDLDEMKDQLDSNSNMSLPGYKRIAVRVTKIGKNNAIKAVEHDFQMQGNVLGRMRSITFVIGSRAYIITCGTSVDRFDNADRTFFQPFLNSIEPVK